MMIRTALESGAADDSQIGLLCRSGPDRFRMRFGLISTVLQHEAGNDFGFADRRIGLLEDSFAEREKAQAGMAPPAVVIGPVDGAGQRDRLGDFLVVSVFTVSSLRLHPAIKRLDAD